MGARSRTIDCGSERSASAHPGAPEARPRQAVRLEELDPMIGYGDQLQPI
jgi:hypothetical protein